VILPDVNVLLYAFRRDSREHSRHREWLHSIVNGPSAYGISPQVLASLLRVSTHPRIFVMPSRLDEAIAFSRALMEPRHCQLVQPGVRHWSIFADLCLQAQATGNLVQDAWLAALAVEHGCEWITHDRDFARFPGLRWRPPF
jgi:uncharacterized protein